MAIAVVAKELRAPAEVDAEIIDPLTVNVRSSLELVRFQNVPELSV